jgi:hypothetical protein
VETVFIQPNFPPRDYSHDISSDTPFAEAGADQAVAESVHRYYEPRRQRIETTGPGWLKRLDAIERGLARHDREALHSAA